MKIQAILDPDSYIAKRWDSEHRYGGTINGVDFKLEGETYIARDVRPDFLQAIGTHPCIRIETMSGVMEFPEVQPTGPGTVTRDEFKVDPSLNPIAEESLKSQPNNVSEYESVPRPTGDEGDHSQPGAQEVNQAVEHPPHEAPKRRGRPPKNRG